MKKYFIFGEKGGISAKVSLPKNFSEQTDKCDMAIVMHGFMASKFRSPIPHIVKCLNDAGIGAISFDFNAHGSSEGKFEQMTLSSEVADARKVFEYVCALPYVRDIFFVGHSQGGVVTGLLAGELAAEKNPRVPAKIVQLAPAAVLKDDANKGVCMGSKYDPVNPPKYVRVLFFNKLGYDFIKEAQKYPIYETSCQYKGKVCLIHGTQDSIVPVSYSERYHQEYPDSELHILQGVGHFMRSKDREVYEILVKFLRGVSNA